jgi:predicted aconitase with swiveling domain
MPVGRVEIVQRGRAVEVRESASSRRASVALIAVFAIGLAAAALALSEDARKAALLCVAGGLAITAVILAARPLLVLRAAEDRSLWRGSDLAAGTGEVRELLIEEGKSGRSGNYWLLAITRTGQAPLAFIDSLGEARKAAGALAVALGVPVREELGPRLVLYRRFWRP